MITNIMGKESFTLEMKIEIIIGYSKAHFKIHVKFFLNAERQDL